MGIIHTNKYDLGEAVGLSRKLVWLDGVRDAVLCRV